MTFDPDCSGSYSSRSVDARPVLLTGGAGFFGGVLKRRLLAEGEQVVSLDIERDPDKLPGLTSVQGDLRDRELLRGLFSRYQFKAVYHVAAQLAHGTSLDKDLLWSSNVDATRLLAEEASRAEVRPFVFISSNCLWGADLGHPVHEERDTPAPVELYGMSKLVAEEVLHGFEDRLDVVILRSPTIMDAGRLGLLAILYEFIHEGRTVWVVGEGTNRYQFIYAEDLATACILASHYGRSDLFHIGSDNVKPMREIYERVIRRSGSRSKVRCLPKKLTLLLMRVAHALGISPLGPYHYRMIAENFTFDTTRIRERLGWEPTLSNEEMLLLAYTYYASNREEISSRRHVSAHRKAADMGVIRVLKWLS